MLLVYTHKITPRLKYVFTHVAKSYLRTPIKFTTVIEEFISHDSLKISYTKQPLGKELFFKSHDLLFEEGISDVEINVSTWDGVKAFFFVGDKSEIPYDIFAASFYLISRYEEYLPHVKDEFGRFTANQSLAYEHGFLGEPIVDIWLLRFKEILQNKFDSFTFSSKSYEFIPVVDVPSAYLYKGKSLMRTVGEVIKDALNFKLKNIYKRSLVLSNLRKDPYDIFTWIINKQKSTNVNFVFFFLVGKYSKYDKNISISDKRFKSLLKTISDYSKVGIKPSYNTLFDFLEFKNEKKSFEQVVNFDIKYSRNSFSKLNLPFYYRDLLNLDIHKDFTMGYVDQIGFRAGTSYPFKFYDLEYEMQTPLEVFPYQLIDSSFLQFNSFLDKSENFIKIKKKVKAVNGTFIPVFHNYSLGNIEKWNGFKKLFELVLKDAND